MYLSNLNTKLLKILTLISPLAFILIASVCFFINVRNELILTISFSLLLICNFISLISFVMIFLKQIFSTGKLCKLALTYSLLAFICMLPLYLISGFYLIEQLNKLI